MVNPMVGREIDFRIEPASTKKRILIIGGGPAGLEAARVAALRGHEVFLYEKEKRLGGQLNLAKVPSGKIEFGKLVAYYEHQMEMLKVRIVHEDVNKEEIKKVKPDVIVIATGGKPNIPEGFVIHSDQVCTAWEVLQGKKIPGKKVVMVGGGLIGCETAEVLLDQGKKVIILEMLDTVAADMSPRARKFLLDKLVEGGVEIIKDARVQEISGTEIKYERVGLVQKIKGFDHAVLALGTAPERTLLNELGEINVPVFSIGDCRTPRRTMEAIREGFDLSIDL
jgi:NADPH-dependent 2,4-dienoyl-CoA reductase/sulfur reductase-like enzyme